MSAQVLPLSETFRQASIEHWQKAIDHKFTHQVGDDTMSDEVYANYLVQDYAFIESLVNLVASAIVKAPSMPEKTVLGQFLGALTSDENTYFLRSFEALNISQEQYSNPVLNPTAQAIIDELNDAAQYDYQDAITVLCVAEWVYLTWCKAQDGKTQSRFYLKEWIDIHVLPEFEAFVNWLRFQVDSFADNDQKTLARLQARFDRMAKLEHEFFSAVY